VDGLLPDRGTEQRLLAVGGERSGQRHGEPDRDRLAGRRLGLGHRRQQGYRGPGEQRGDGASPFESCKHRFLQLAHKLVARDFLAVPLLLSRPPENRRYCRPHTSSATSTIKRSFAHCSSSARILPSSVEAKPHCGDRHNCSMSTYLAASSMRRLMASLLSSAPALEVTSPSTTCFLPLGTKRSGSKPPARALSYSRK